MISAGGIPPKVEAQDISFPLLARHKDSGNYLILAAPTIGAYISGDYAGLRFESLDNPTEIPFYLEVLPVGFTVQLTQED